MRTVQPLQASLLLVTALAACAGPVRRSAAPGVQGRALRVVYFDPADRASVPDFRGRLDRAMTLIQGWFRGEMERNGFGPLTFPLERDAEGRLVVHVVRSSRAYALGEEIPEDEIRDLQVAPALRAEGIDVDREHLVIFANTVFTSTEERGLVLHSSSVYGGLGDAASGTAWVTDCALLDPRNLEAEEPIVWDGGERRYTLGHYNVVYLGGVAHELGHAFGLPHDAETEAQHAASGWSLMGSGNYHFCARRAGDVQESFLTLAEATMLSTHPLFTGADGPAAAPEVAWHDLVFASGRGEYVVRGRVEARPRARAVVAFHDDECVPADYDATAWVAPVDDAGRFEVHVGALMPGHYELRLRACLEDGGEATCTWRLALDGDCALVHDSLEPVPPEDDGESGAAPGRCFAKTRM